MSGELIYTPHGFSPPVRAKFIKAKSAGISIIQILEGPLAGKFRTIQDSKLKRIEAE